MRRPLRFAPILALVAAVAAGCSNSKTFSPDLPPETTLFVSGKLDTVNHVARLHWFGSDQDGQVVGFEFRFRRLDPPADSSWHFTTANDSLFTVYSPAGHTLPVFEVRAVDDAGQPDPSPAGADFAFSNQPPVVKFIDAPAASDTTFPATTVSWKITDIDGIAAKAHYLLWLDGGAANPLVVDTRTFTIPPAAFAEGGVFYTRQRTLYLQAIDDGGMPGNIDSTSWIVRAPAEGADHAELLVLDDVATNDAVDATLDSLYVNAATRDLAPGRFQVLRLKTTKAFRSQQDLAYAFSLFDAVAWTRGTTSPFRNPDYLASYQDGIATYVNRGGHFLVEGSYLIRNTSSAGSTTGALRPDLVADLTGVTPSQHVVSGRPGEYSYEWAFNVNGGIRSSTFALDTTLTAKRSSAVSVYDTSDTTLVALWAKPGAMTNDTGAHAIGLSAPVTGSGRFVIIGTSLYAIDRPGKASAPALLHQILHQFGITGP